MSSFTVWFWTRKHWIGARHSSEKENITLTQHNQTLTVEISVMIKCLINTGYFMTTVHYNVLFSLLSFELSEENNCSFPFLIWCTSTWSVYFFFKSMSRYEISNVIAAACPSFVGHLFVLWLATSIWTEEWRYLHENGLQQFESYTRIPHLPETVEFLPVCQ